VIESISVEHLQFCSESSGRFNRYPHRELASFRRTSQQPDCGADIDARISTNDVLIDGDSKMRNSLVSAALRAALPADTEVLPSSITPPLQFRPLGVKPLRRL
jgi:hypothetical protein